MATIGIMVTMATAAITMMTKNTVTTMIANIGDGNGDSDNRGREKRVRWKMGPRSANNGREKV